MPRPLCAAGIDVGTNSVLLTAARPTEAGLVALEERCVVTRLGEGLAERGRLGRAAVDRTVAVLSELGAAVVALGAEARAVGTSALRRADNADELLERARAALGFPLEVLSGEHEARLSFRGALSDLPGLEPGARPLVVDPGGGSTELIGAGVGATSLELGAVRLTEAFLRGDPPRADELEALVAHVRAGLAPVTFAAAGRPVVAVGGTATTLAALSAGLERYDASVVHGRALALSEVSGLAERLAAMSLAERERLGPLPPGRADVIVAGALLLAELLARLGASSVTVSDRGLRHGLVAEIVDGWGPENGSNRPLSYRASSQE